MLLKNKYLLIINPVSGDKRGKQWGDKIRALLHQHMFSIDILYTKYKNHAKFFIMKLNPETYQSILIFGGDGTYNEVINGILLRKDNYSPILGFIPGGTGNAVMHHLGYLDPQKALTPIINDSQRKIDVMQINYLNTIEYSINIIGWGMIADIGLLSEKMRWLGSLRYTIASLIYILKLNKRGAKLTIDKKTYNDCYLFISISNTIFTGKGMKISPNAKLDDGLLDVILLSSNITRFQLLKLLPKIFTGGHITSKAIEYINAKNINLQSRNNTMLNIDGEIKGETPVSVSILDKKLTIYN